MALSPNDYHLAMKFGNYVRIFDILNGTFFYHKLPVQNGRSGPNDHLIAFSTDGISFIASTRFEPEKVISYVGNCQDMSNGNTIESNAPYVSLNNFYKFDSHLNQDSIPQLHGF